MSLKDLVSQLYESVTDNLPTVQAEAPPDEEEEEEEEEEEDDEPKDMKDQLEEGSQYSEYFWAIASLCFSLSLSIYLEWAFLFLFIFYLTNSTGGKENGKKWGDDEQASLFYTVSGAISWDWISVFYKQFLDD